MLVVLRVMRASLLILVLAWWLGMYVFVSRGFTTPVPASAQNIYLGIVTLALFAYVTSSAERVAVVLAATPQLRRRPALHAAARSSCCWRCRRSPPGASTRTRNVPVEPPFFARTVHPSPPTEITVHNEKIDMLGSDNPLRAPRDRAIPRSSRRTSRTARTTYYKQCFFCHADALGGDGMYAHGVNPAPANFIDQGVLPNFQETFFFWRIAKGGPGMPDEGGPGDSAMPEWERFLSERGDVGGRPLPLRPHRLPAARARRAWREH